MQICNECNIIINIIFNLINPSRKSTGHLQLEKQKPKTGVENYIQSLIYTINTILKYKELAKILCKCQRGFLQKCLQQLCKGKGTFSPIWEKVHCASPECRVRTSIALALSDLC